MTVGDGTIIAGVVAAIAGVAAALTAATPLVLAGLGELLTERAGVLNLGVEGLMLVGALAGFAAVLFTGSAVLGIVAAGVAGAALAAPFAFLVISLPANQVAAGLALALLGAGLSAVVGQGLVGIPLAPLPVVAGLDGMAWATLALVPLVHFGLFHTRAGLILRAVGENPKAARALGYQVIRIRWAATLAGGALGGISGAYLSLAYTPMWAENISAGRGWIAIALVVFAGWRPWRVLLGAWLFGGVSLLDLHAQGWGLDVPAPFLSMLPYVAAIAALLLSAGRADQAPAALGRPFQSGR